MLSPEVLHWMKAPTIIKEEYKCKCKELGEKTSGFQFSNQFWIWFINISDFTPSSSKDKTRLRCKCNVSLDMVINNVHWNWVGHVIVILENDCE